MAADTGASAWRRILVLATTGLALAAIGAIFWHQDLRYSLPTPRPVGLAQPAIGTTIDPQLLPTGPLLSTPGMPLLLHFYNPDCPCSRFNRDHVQALQLRFGTQVQFVAVIESLAAAPREPGLQIPHVLDRDGALARQLGVYSTPQAVLLDGGRRLVYRGNYNVSRYCDDRPTQYARLAIESLLGNSAIAMEPEASIAYGCTLPAEERPDDSR